MSQTAGEDREENPCGQDSSRPGGERVKRKDLARLTERSVKTIERWVSDDAELERFRPTRSEAIVIAYVTGYPVSRYTGEVEDDVLFPLARTSEELMERLRALEARAAERPAR